jgi:hypothetical protein
MVPSRGRFSIAGWELVLPLRSWERVGMVSGGMLPSPIHKRPFLWPSPASTATSGSKSEVRGSASSPCTSLNFCTNLVLRNSDPLFTHIDPVVGWGFFLVCIVSQNSNTLGSTPVFLAYKRDSILIHVVASPRACIVPWTIRLIIALTCRLAPWTMHARS